MFSSETPSFSLHYVSPGEMDKIHFLSSIMTASAATATAKGPQ
jgi:hypothetical protein